MANEKERKEREKERKRKKKKKEEKCHWMEVFGWKCNNPINENSGQFLQVYIELTLEKIRFSSF